MGFLRENWVGLLGVLFLVGVPIAGIAIALNSPVHGPSSALSAKLR